MYFIVIVLSCFCGYSGFIIIFIIIITFYPILWWLCCFFTSVAGRYGTTKVPNQGIDLSCIYVKGINLFIRVSYKILELFSPCLFLFFILFQPFFSHNLAVSVICGGIWNIHRKPQTSLNKLTNCRTYSFIEYTY